MLAATPRPLRLRTVAKGPTSVLYLATGIISLGAVASWALVLAAARAWKNRWFTMGGRIYFALLALTAPYLLWWANYWNLLGFRF